MAGLTPILLLACTRAPTLGPGGQAPDIVLISVDTLRADHLGVYGYPRPITPEIDKLAASGTRFADARSASPWTLPSHTTMLTGLLPNHHQVVDDTLRVGEGLPWLPESLGQAGYRTGAVVSTIYVGKRFGFDRGFSLFEDFGLKGERQNLKGELRAEQVVDRALSFVAENTGQSVFLFLHLYDVHYPYSPPSPFDEALDRPSDGSDPVYKNYAYYRRNPLSADQMAHQLNQYDEEIAYVDHELGRLINAFAAAQRSALWVLTADHGEELGERGSWGHAHTLYPEQLHVPLIVSGPGVQSGAVVQTTVGLQDLAATLAEAAGLRWGGDGLSLWPALRGEPLPERAFLCDTSRFHSNRLGLYWGGLRLDWDLARGAMALYADPEERQDVAAERPEDLARLRAELVRQYGLSWEADRGEITTKGAFFDESGPLPSPLTIEGPRRFAVAPVDAAVKVDGRGPYRAAGGQPPPSGAPLRYTGGVGAVESALSDEDKAELEALGYIQGDGE